METQESILERLEVLRSPGTEWVWVSGGEPALQLDPPLVDLMHRFGYRVAVETNGTRSFRPGVVERLDHITVSPKLPFEQTVVRKANTLKVLWPHPNPLIRPEHFHEFEADVRFVQPVDYPEDPDLTDANVHGAIRLLYGLPGWRLGVQLHKLIGVD